MKDRTIKRTGPLNTIGQFVLATLVLSAALPCSAQWEPTELAALQYPPLAKQARLTGIVVVRIELEEDGSVASAHALTGHPLLAMEVQKNVLRWKFRQVSSDAPRTEQHPYLIYHFRLEGRCSHAAACRTEFTVEYPNYVVVKSEIPPIHIHYARPQ